jgi:hypothetical protein
LRRSYGIILAVLGVSAGAGCSGDQDESIDIVHDVCAPPRLMAPTATEVQALGIDLSTQLWRARGVPQLGLGATESIIEVRFEGSSSPSFGYYDDETGVIYINAQISDPSVLSIVIAHELGHAFGLLHVERDDRASLMNPGNIATPPTEADQHELERLWGVCQ